MPKFKSTSAAGPSSKPARTSSSKTKADSAARTISGFHVLPVSVSASPSSSKKKSKTDATTHYIYLRAHHAPAQSSDLPKGRTLFLVNLPVDTTERHLRHLFEKCGRVEGVKIKRRGGGGEDGSAGVAEEDMMEDSEAEGEDEDAGAPQEGAGAGASRIRPRNGKDAPNKPTIPTVVPLPPLDPRGPDAPLLQTGGTAHVVFLEEDGLSRALALAAEASSSSAKLPVWIDPRVQVQHAFEEAKKRSGEASDEEDPGNRKKRSRPSTALEAQAAALASDPAPPTGLLLLLRRHDALRPALAQVKAHADAAVARYTFLRANPRLDPERLRAGYAGLGGIKVASYGPDGEPLDEDGFTIVLPGGKYGRSLGAGGAADGGAGAGGGAVKVARQSRTDAEALKAKQESKMEGLEDFYRFQTRERRKEKLANMRRQFEEDKLKVEKLKESGGGKRRFRPY